MDSIVPLYAELARVKQEEQRALAMQALAHLLRDTHGAEFAHELTAALATVLDGLGGLGRRRAARWTGEAWRVPSSVCR